MSKPRVLTVCTGNSMRSQLGEALLRHDLGDQIEACSAGVHPGCVHPLTIEVLEDLEIDCSELRSKSIAEFIDVDVDLVITVCDYAAEVCPVLPRARKIIHMGYPDPIRLSGTLNAREMMTALRDQMREDLRELVVKELGLSD